MTATCFSGEGIEGKRSVFFHFYPDTRCIRDDFKSICFNYILLPSASCVPHLKMPHSFCKVLMSYFPMRCHPLLAFICFIYIFTFITGHISQHMLLIICKRYCFCNCHDNWSTSLPWLIPKHIAKVHSNPIHVYSEESPIEWSSFSFKLTYMYLGRRSNRWGEMDDLSLSLILLTSGHRRRITTCLMKTTQVELLQIFFFLQSKRRYEQDILPVIDCYIFRW